MRPVVSVVLAFLGVVCGWGSTSPLPDQNPSGDLGLKMIVLEGEDGVNIVKKKSAVRPVVQVKDKNDLPVSGASVVFLLPNSGATGVFANGAHSLTVITDSAGRAAVTGFKPVGTGAFKISVTASYQNSTATASISQTNYLTVAAAQSAGATVSGAAAGGGGLSTGAIIGIIAAVGAAAGAGIALGKKGSSKTSPSTSTTPTGTIGAGTVPVFGPPH